MWGRRGHGVGNKQTVVYEHWNIFSKLKATDSFKMCHERYDTWKSQSCGKVWGESFASYSQRMSYWSIINLFLKNQCQWETLTLYTLDRHWAVSDLHQSKYSWCTKRINVCLENIKHSPTQLYDLSCLFFPTPRVPAPFNHTRLLCQGIHNQFLTCRLVSPTLLLKDVETQNKTSPLELKKVRKTFK